MNNSSFECATWTTKDENLYKVFSYWIGGIAVIFVAIVGIILNVAGTCLILAFRLSKHNIFNHIIIILFIVDSLFLFVKIIDVLVQNLDVKNKILTILFPKFAYPVSAICLTLSVFLTVGIAHERFIAIKYLIVHSQQNSSAKFRRNKLMKYILPMLFFAIAFNVPKFFEADLEWTSVNRSSDKDSDKLSPIIKVTDLRTNPLYVMYYQNVAAFLVLGMIPLCLLIYWNYNIYIQMKKSTTSMLQCNGSSYHSSRSTNGCDLNEYELDLVLIQKQRKESKKDIEARKNNELKRVLSNAPSRHNQEKELAKVLIGIVVTFVCCHATRIFFNLYEALVIKTFQDCQDVGEIYYSVWAYLAIDFSRLMQVVNSSVNIIIYYCLSTSFRKDMHNVCS